MWGLLLCAAALTLNVGSASAGSYQSPAVKARHDAKAAAAAYCNQAELYEFGRFCIDSQIDCAAVLQGFDCAINNKLRNVSRIGADPRDIECRRTRTYDPEGGKQDGREPAPKGWTCTVKEPICLFEDYWGCESWDYQQPPPTLAVTVPELQVVADVDGDIRCEAERERLERDYGDGFSCLRAFSGDKCWLAPGWAPHGSDHPNTSAFGNCTLKWRVDSTMGLTVYCSVDIQLRKLNNRGHNDNGGYPDTGVATYQPQVCTEDWSGVA